MQHLWLRTILVAVAMTGGVLVKMAPGAAQSGVNPGNVTHLRTGDDRYDRTGPTSWDRSRNAEITKFTEDRHDETTIFLSRNIPGTTERVQFNLSSMMMDGGITTVEGNQGTGSAYLGAISEAWADCTPQTAPAVKCTCNLDALRPLQGALGLGEVAKKKKDIEEAPVAERDDLDMDPIKVVRGPGSALFVTDHHHGARAWLDAKYSTGTCQLLDKPVPTTEAEFWVYLENNKLVRLVNAEGDAMAKTGDLPRRLQDLPDDPYRTLAWLVRKKDGFCKSSQEFAEFTWADWMRDQGKTAVPALALPEVARATSPALWADKKKNRDSAQRPVLEIAVPLATSSVAGPDGAKLPGWKASTAVACPAVGGGDE